MAKQCEYCLHGHDDDGTRSQCHGIACEYFTPLTPEMEDEMILDAVDRERGEYYEAFFEYVNQDGSFDFD